MSKLFKRIYSIERHKTLLEKAKKILNNLNISNIVFYHGDGIKGWPANFLFERIIVTAVAKSLPAKIIKQMSNECILVLPLVHDNEQYITKIIKKNNKI